MSMDRLTQVGEGLVKRFGTRDPLEIAEDIGIEVLYCDNFGPLTASSGSGAKLADSRVSIGYRFGSEA